MTWPLIVINAISPVIRLHIFNRPCTPCRNPRCLPFSSSSPHTAGNVHPFILSFDVFNSPQVKYYLSYCRSFFAWRMYVSRQSRGNRESESVFIIPRATVPSDLQAHVSLVSCEMRTSCELLSKHVFFCGPRKVHTFIDSQ